MYSSGLSTTCDQGSATKVFLVIFYDNVFVIQGETEQREPILSSLENEK